MPPRKSDSSKAGIGDEGAASAPAPSKREDGINIEDLNLPKSIVTRLAKGVLAPNTQVQGNAMLALSKSATVFVNYLATHANEYAQGANRKTIAPPDVFKALESLGFDFKPRLEAELAKFNEVQADKRNTYRKKIAADKTSKSGGAAGSSERNAAEDGGNAEPVAKKPRRDVESAPDGSDDHGEVLDEDGMGEIGDEEQEEPDVDDVEDEEEGADEADEPPEDALEEPEEKENDDEALDNGEDSD